jgi:hypothetical protein
MVENQTWKDNSQTVLLFESNSSLNHDGLLVIGGTISGWGPVQIKFDA